MFEACDAGAAIIYVPAVVVVEFGLVFGGRRTLSAMSLRDFFEGLFANPAYQPFDLTPEQVFFAVRRARAGRPTDAAIAERL